MEEGEINHDYDYIVIGSGFGGSVSALRLAEKGYKVLVIEKGKWYKQEDFPKTNWNLPRMFWAPTLRFFGIMKMTFFRHITILSGVGVGGGSLVYANTLPVPKAEFFNSGNWKGLADWEGELRPFYQTAKKMLGAAPNPRLEEGDLALKELAAGIGREEQFEAADVAVYFGQPGQTAPDPYFDGKGPERAGCTFCGGCMTGCRHNAKNTLDKNYLFLAQRLGVEILAESEVMDVTPIGEADGSDGYAVRYRSSTAFFKNKKSATSRGIVFAGGVLGTIPLLLRLREASLPRLSARVGYDIRTNNESLIPVTTFDKSKDLSKGVAIGSILHTDENSHLEPVRYSSGSGFWRWLLLPMAHGGSFAARMGKIFKDWLSNPLSNLKVLFVDDWARRTSTLLFMQHLDSTLRLRRERLGYVQSSVDKGEAPSAFIPRAEELAQRYARILNGKATVFGLEPILGIPSTAHILGGAAMGKDAGEGVIDKNNKVFGYENMLVCDGSMISANPGVNPSLTITAISERAMSLIPEKRISRSFKSPSRHLL
ncbi:MAG: GMC family oxidoreductase [Phaeodactylibacter sp.]|nr:GMC family oxidoreductase [Phaeodactylibacter sp.]